MPKGRNPSTEPDLEHFSHEDEEVSHKQPEISEITAAEILKRAEAASNAISQDRREYHMNHAFLEGKQWIKWVDREKAFVPWKRRGGRYQATVNKLDGLVTTYMGKITRADMVFNVPASTADDYALQGALVAESIITHKHDVCDWESKREELTLAAIKGGTAALVVEWDAAAKSYGSVRTGDTVERVLNITEFAVEPGAKDATHARWWVQQQVLPTEEVQSLYKLEYEPKAEHRSGGPYAMGLGDGMSPQAKGCLVTTYYERPNFLRPEGVVAVVVNNKMVWGPKAWPFPFKDRLNLEVVRETVVDRQWHGLTRLSKARPVQVQYNFVSSNIEDHIKKVGTAKLVAPHGSSDALDTWDDDPANPVRYPDGSSPPQYLSPPSLPAYILNRLEALDNAMQDIMGIHGISQGEAPANIESGFGLQTLAEQDASPATALAKRVARAFAKTASSVLELYVANVRETRKATVYAPDSKVAETHQWTGKTIAGQTKVIIPQDAIIPHSRAAMQQFAETLAKMGLLPPGQEGLTLMLELAEVPNREQSLWYVNPAEARSRHDVARIMQGEVVYPQSFHNHKVAISVANRARMSPRYDTMPKQRREALDLFIKTHEMMDIEEAGKQMGQAAISPALANAADANEPTPLPPELLGVAPQPAQLPAAPAGDQVQLQGEMNG